MTLKTNIDEKNLSLEFRLRKMDKTRNYVIKEIKQNDLMSKKTETFARL